MWSCCYAKDVPLHPENRDLNTDALHNNLLARLRRHDQETGQRSPSASWHRTTECDEYSARGFRRSRRLLSTTSCAARGNWTLTHSVHSVAFHVSHPGDTRSISPPVRKGPKTKSTIETTSGTQSKCEIETTSQSKRNPEP